ncbi:MAG: hypothetical protein WDW38_001628 [Sanguina aurantia]
MKTTAEPNSLHINSLIIATKAADTEAALRSVMHRLAPSSHVLLLQNGTLAVYEQLHRNLLSNGNIITRLPSFACGSLTHGATQTSPFHVTQASSHGACMLSPVDPTLDTLLDPRHALLRASTVLSCTHQNPTFSASITPSTPSCDPATPEPHTHGGAAAAAAAPTAHQHQQATLHQQLLHLLSPVGLGGSFGAVLAASHSDFLRNIHTKLAVNCAINPLTALLRCKNGGLLRSDETRALVRQLTAEVAGICPPELGLTKEGLFETALAVALTTAGNTSSMLADVLAGRRTEVDYLLGYVTSRCKCESCGTAGGTAACSTPNHSMLHKLIRANQGGLIGARL